VLFAVKMRGFAFELSWGDVCFSFLLMLYVLWPFTFKRLKKVCQLNGGFY
jgi:hypothetical protein